MENTDATGLSREKIHAVIVSHRGESAKLARRLRVNKVFVSQALTGGWRVGQKMRARILSAAGKRARQILEQEREQNAAA